MKIAERIVIVVLILIFIGGGAWIYAAVQFEHQKKVDAVARGEYEIRPSPTATPSDTPDWRVLYPDTVPIVIGEVTMLASIADTLPERIQGLSNTPYLPDNVVKLFVFGVNGAHSIWMKDMNYALDILWVSEAGEIVHIEEDVAPESFPESFSSPTPAWYVIEANAGFVKANTIDVGQKVSITVAN